MMPPLPWGVGAARRRALRRAPPGPMRLFLQTPPPPAGTPCRKARIAALDLEATGPDPRRHNILSMGLVEVQALAIHLDSAWHQLLQPAQEIPEASAILHRITDDRAAAAGIPLAAALPQLLARLAGRVLLVHGGHLEQEFLDAACRAHYGTPFVIPTIDTLALAHRILARQHPDLRGGDLRLFNLRSRFHLPCYQAHNALNDALATAELFLALAAELAPRGDLRLKTVLTR